MTRQARHAFGFFRGRPPFFPFSRAVAALAAELTEPPLRPNSEAAALLTLRLLTMTP